MIKSYIKICDFILVKISKCSVGHFLYLNEVFEELGTVIHPIDTNVLSAH